MQFTRLGKITSYSDFSERIFQGEIFLFRTNSMQKFIQAARKLATDTFGIPDARKSHLELTSEDFLEKVAQAQKSFNQLDYKNLLLKSFQELQIPLQDLYWDYLGLRIAAPVGKMQKKNYRSFVPVHRDTWGSGIQCQINWWSPIWEVTENSTMGFYTGYWKKPLKNTTKEWSFQKYLASRKQKNKAEAAEYPSAPSALEEPQEKIKPILIEPGELLAFSSAHLHSSIENTTNNIRFSMEIRTINQQDWQNKKGAPNVDCYSEEPLLRLFRSVTENQPFPKE